MRKKELVKQLEELRAGLQADNQEVHEKYTQGYEDAKAYRPRRELSIGWHWKIRQPQVTSAAFQYAYECGYQGGLSEREAIEQRIVNAIAERAGVAPTPEAVAAVLGDTTDTDGE